MASPLTGAPTDDPEPRARHPNLPARAQPCHSIAVMKTLVGSLVQRPQAAVNMQPLGVKGECFILRHQTARLPFTRRDVGDSTLGDPDVLALPGWPGAHQPL